MSNRKPFQDLSKSQKNRRLKKVYQSLYQMAYSLAHENIDDETSNDVDDTFNTHPDHLDQVDPLAVNNITNNMETSENENDDKVVVKVEKEEELIVTDSDFPTSDDNQGDDRVPHDRCCAGCRHDMDLILRKLDEIIALMMENAKLQSENHVTNMNLLPQFPIRDIDQLSAFNEILSNSQEARLQYKNMIQLRGGKDVKQHVREILVIVLTNELAKTLSWSGQKNTISVKNMKFVEILVESQISAGQVTVYDVKSTIQNWLQHATDRIKYAEKKNQA